MGLIQLLSNKFVDNLRHSVQLLLSYSLIVILSLLMLPHFDMECHRVSSHSVNASGSPGTLIQDRIKAKGLITGWVSRQCASLGNRRKPGTRQGALDHWESQGVLKLASLNGKILLVVGLVSEELRLCCSWLWASQHVLESCCIYGVIDPCSKALNSLKISLGIRSGLLAVKFDLATFLEFPYCVLNA